VRVLTFFLVLLEVDSAFVVVLALPVRFMTVANELIPEEEQNEAQQKE
jgi:hypothetical protein